MPLRQLLTDPIREYLKSGDILSAIVRTSTDLEHLFFMKLYFEKQISSELIDTWTLGKYIRWNIKLGLIDQKWYEILHDFNKLRTNVVHDRTFIVKIKNDKELLEMVKNLVIQICNFIDQTQVKYVSTKELERSYGLFLDKNEKEVIVRLLKYK